MTETHPEPVQLDDPSAAVADTYAPAHLEERGVDEAAERAIEEASNGQSPAE